jgi:hypothetical protein
MRLCGQFVLVMSRSLRARVGCLGDMVGGKRDRDAQGPPLPPPPPLRQPAPGYERLVQDVPRNRAQYIPPTLPQPPPSSERAPVPAAVPSTIRHPAGALPPAPPLPLPPNSGITNASARMAQLQNDTAARFGSPISASRAQPGSGLLRQLRLQKEHSAKWGLTFTKDHLPLTVSGVRPDGAAALTLEVGDEVVTVDGRMPASFVDGVNAFALSSVLAVGVRKGAAHGPRHPAIDPHSTSAASTVARALDLPAPPPPLPTTSKVTASSAIASAAAQLPDGKKLLLSKPKTATSAAPDVASRLPAHVENVLTTLQNSWSLGRVDDLRPLPRSLPLDVHKRLDALFTAASRRHQELEILAALPEDMRNALPAAESAANMSVAAARLQDACAAAPRIDSSRVRSKPLDQFAQMVTCDSHLAAVVFR